MLDFKQKGENIHVRHAVNIEVLISRCSGEGCQFDFQAVAAALEDSEDSIDVNM